MVHKMIDLIRQKLNELDRNMPSNPEFKDWIYQSNIWNWIYTVMNIEGLHPKRPEVVSLANGDLSANLPLYFYNFGGRIKNIMEDMQGYLYMESRLEEKMIYRWVAFLRGSNPGGAGRELLRQNCNVIYEWDHIPVSESDVADGLESLIMSYHLKLKKGCEPLDAALSLFLGMCKLYPFGEESVSMSLVVLMFNLMSAGYPLPELPVNDREFNSMMARYVESGNPAEFKSMLERSIYNRVEYMNNLALMAKENS